MFGQEFESPHLHFLRNYIVLKPVNDFTGFLLFRTHGFHRKELAWFTTSSHLSRQFPNYINEMD